MGAAIHTGRYTARVPADGVVVFLIGARVNSLLRPRSLWQVASAMPRMMRRLVEQPELGLRHAEHFRSGRTTLSLQYWESREALLRFASDPDLPHAAAWHRFVRELSDRPDVGIWHETYDVPAGNVEAVYGHMPRFGLAAATEHVPIAAVGHNARARFAEGARRSTSAVG